MTLYEFRCVACRALFEERRPMESRNDPATCPQCGGPGRRVFSRPQAHKGVWQQPVHPEKLRTTKEIWE